MDRRNRELTTTQLDPGYEHLDSRPLLRGLGLEWTRLERQQACKPTEAIAIKASVRTIGYCVLDADNGCILDMLYTSQQWKQIRNSKPRKG